MSFPTHMETQAAVTAHRPRTRGGRTNAYAEGNKTRFSLGTNPLHPNIPTPTNKTRTEEKKTHIQTNPRASKTVKNILWQ